LQLGLNFFNSRSVKDFSAYWWNIDLEEDPDAKLKDHKQMGAFFGHELLFNNMSLITQVGYYVYKPLNHGAPVYQIVGFKRYLFKDKSALSINLKIHYFEAEYISLGYHHKIF
jgi:hypothetical protein